MFPHFYFSTSQENIQPFTHFEDHEETGYAKPKKHRVQQFRNCSPVGEKVGSKR